MNYIESLFFKEFENIVFFFIICSSLSFIILFLQQISIVASNFLLILPALGLVFFKALLIPMHLLMLGFMKILHPDKAHTPEAKRLNMSHDDKMRYLNLIVESYKIIKETYRDKKTTHI